MAAKGRVASPAKVARSGPQRMVQNRDMTPSSSPQNTVVTVLISPSTTPSLSSDAGVDGQRGGWNPTPMIAGLVSGFTLVFLALGIYLVWRRRQTRRNVTAEKTLGAPTGRRQTSARLTISAPKPLSLPTSSQSFSSSSSTIKMTSPWSSRVALSAVPILPPGLHAIQIPARAVTAPFKDRPLHVKPSVSFVEAQKDDEADVSVEDERFTLVYPALSPPQANGPLSRRDSPGW